MYEAIASRESQFRSIPVNAAETNPLVGISYGYDLQIHTVESGTVTIEARRLPRKRRQCETRVRWRLRRSRTKGADR